MPVSVIRPAFAAERVAPFPAETENLIAKACKARDRAADWLLYAQKPDGHWVAELEGDTILESEYILLMAFFGRENEADCLRAAKSMTTQVLPGGGWAIHPGGKPDISASVKAYFALKLTGTSVEEPFMLATKRVILDLGGAQACNSFTRFYLALLGQLTYDSCPSVPPEIMLLPRWFPVHLGEMSSWTRTIVVPLAIVSACRPVKHLPAEKGIRDLFLEDPLKARWPSPPTRRWISWTNFFLGVDATYKLLEPVLRATGLRRKGLDRSLAWMRERFQQSDGLGAIFPPMIYTILALDCMGVPQDAAEAVWARKQLEDLKLRDSELTWLQPCVSPVWDTALSLNALAEANLGPKDQAVESAGEWLLAREVRRKGDWADRVPDCEPGGWVFEYNNSFYPDTDDTAMVLMALTRTGLAAKPEYRPAVRRALDWLVAMQDDNGGWAAFDRGINREFLEKVPFADHNAMLDPCCPDITARVLEALAPHGMVQGDPLADKAIEFLRSRQESFGAWIGRWGVNYLYGTWQVLAGLHACGVSPDDPMVCRAADWLESVQQPSGAWGEGCESYEDKSLAGIGTPTASQTAWALLGLIFAGRAKGRAARAGARWLAETQVNGTWKEEPFTGTGFPKVFYLKYHYYRHYFPLMALGRWVKAVGATH